MSASGVGAPAVSAAGFLERRFFLRGSAGSRSAVALPPAAVIFSRALSENECAVTDSFFFSSPCPRILTSARVFLTRPFSTSVSTLTVSPSANTRSRSRRFTGCVYVRNGPIGIASFEVAPRCLPTRMYSGIWPPSKPARILFDPERDFWPLIPRPE